MVYTDISITINSVDLSASLIGLEMEEGAEAVAAEAMGDSHRWFQRGMEVYAVTATFEQDYSSGGVDDTISALPDTFTVAVLPTSAVVGANNPSFTTTMMVENYQRFSGNIGDRAVCQLQLVLAADPTTIRAEA